MVKRLDGDFGLEVIIQSYEVYKGFISKSRTVRVEWDAKRGRDRPECAIHIYPAARICMRLTNTSVERCNPINSAK